MYKEKIVLDRDIKAKYYQFLRLWNCGCELFQILLQHESTIINPDFLKKEIDGRFTE